MNTTRQIIRNLESILPSPLWAELDSRTTIEPSGEPFSWDAGLTVQVFTLNVHDKNNPKVIAYTRVLHLTYTDEDSMRQSYGEVLPVNPIVLIKMIHVDSTQRRNGIGSYMIEKILDYFKSCGSYSEMLFWGEVYPDGVQLKKQFDAKYGINKADERRRLRKGQAATEAIKPTIWDDLDLSAEVSTDGVKRTEDGPVKSMVLNISVADENAGHLDFSLGKYPDGSRNFITIDWINVYPQFRRMGLGTFMVEYLIKRYVPYKDIYWHYLMNDGKALKATLDIKYGKNELDSEWRRRQGLESDKFDYTE